MIFAVGLCDSDEAVGYLSRYPGRSADGLHPFKLRTAVTDARKVNHPIAEDARQGLKDRGGVSVEFEMAYGFSRRR